MTREQHIKRIEAEFGMSFDDVIADFAKDHSFYFTIEALELDRRTFAFIKDRFKPRLMPKQERPHITRRNLDNAPSYGGLTVREIAKRTGMSRSTITWRIRHGWTVEKILNTKPTRGNVANFGTNRNNKTWVDIITRECKGKENATKHPSR